MAAFREGGEVGGLPWPLTRAEVDAFAAEGLEPVQVEQLPHPDDARVLRWRAELRRASTG